MIITVTVTNDQLADLAAAEAHRHPARTPARRAAAHAFASLSTTTTIGAALRAVSTFGEPCTHDAAVRLIRQLAATVAAATEGNDQP